MLSKLHQQKILVWLELFSDLEKVFLEDRDNDLLIKEKWTVIEAYLKSEIMTLSRDDLADNQQSLFQSWQTETYRYFRLLQTDFIFFRSSKQPKTKDDRFLLIQQRLKDIINLTENYIQASSLN